jgi:hypothetical protein
MFGLCCAMAHSPTLSEHAYAVLIDSRQGNKLPFRWNIVNSRTREVVQTSEIGHRTMDAAFTAAGPTLQKWRDSSRR